jgi:hypothetical protein
MKRSWAARALALGLALGLGALSPLARAEGDPDLRRLFPERASIEAGDAAGASLWRLELTAPVIAACRPDLSDLRILDARDQAVPFVLDAGRPPSASGIERRPARVLAAGRRESPRSGNAATRHIETFELALPPPRTPERGWQLVLEADAPEFVRQLVIEGIHRDAPPRRVLGSVFRIRGLAEQGLSSPLPNGPFERLLVQLVGEEPFPLRPRFFFETAQESPAPRVLRVLLQVASVESIGSERRFMIERPPGIVPGTLRLETPTPAFERRVEVFDVARGRGVASIGKGNVFRMPIDPRSRASSSSSPPRRARRSRCASTMGTVRRSRTWPSAPWCARRASCLRGLPTPSAGRLSTSAAAAREPRVMTSAVC